LESKIPACSHYMLIVSDHPASHPLLERPQCRRSKNRTPIVKSIANFLTENCINASRLA
jgi:hypothetical protein